MKKVFILTILITAAIVALELPYPMEYVSAPFSFNENIDKPFTGDISIAKGHLLGTIYSSAVKANLDDLTGFGLRIRGELPGGTSIFAEIFWSYDGEKWIGPITDWEIEPNDEEGFHDGYLYSNPYYTDKPPAKYYRTSLTLFGTEELKPIVEGIEFVFMDCGWTDYEVRTVIPESIVDWPMPEYVPRGPTGWNCAVPDTFNTGTPTYYTVITHVTVHHTAGATPTPADPCAQMRNIWSYHVLTRGWNDIGYNFVLDHLGNIYHGRYTANPSSLDVRPAQVSYHNANGMGFSVMGNFDEEGIYIHEPTWPAIYDLITWKCSQRDIDPYGTAWNGDPGYEQDAPCILGHKDWTSASTACPGRNFHPEIPSIRDTVYNRLYEPAGDADTFIVDNGDAGFTEGGTWFEGTWSPELAWDSDYEYCNSGGELAWARWTPTLSYPDSFEVYMMWIAGSNRSDNILVNIVSTDNDTVFVNQQGSGCEWHYLGLFYFDVGTDGYVELNDRYDDEGVVMADAVMWISTSPLDIASKNPVRDKIILNISPNPFNSSVRVSVNVGAVRETPVQIEIFDLLGTLRLRSVPDTPRLLSGVETTGSHTFIWQPDESIPSGVYLVRVKSGNCSVVRKIALIR